MFTFNDKPQVSLSAEQNIGALTWAAGVAPSGTINKKYKWTQVGNLVMAFFKIDAAVAGTAVTQLDFPLPADMPVPATFASQANSTAIAIGSGGMAIAGLSAAVGGVCSLIKDSGGVATIEIISAALSTTNAWAHISYLA